MHADRASGWDNALIFIARRLSLFAFTKMPRPRRAVFRSLLGGCRRRRLGRAGDAAEDESPRRYRAPTPPMQSSAGASMMSMPAGRLIADDGKRRTCRAAARQAFDAD